MHGRLLAFFAIALFLFVGVGTVQTAYWDSSTVSEPQVGFDENVSVVEGTTVSITNVSGKTVAYAPQEDIAVSQSGSSIDAGGNWSWNRHNGTLDIAGDSAFSTAVDANITGYWTVPNAQQNATKEIAMLPTDFGSAWELAAMVMLVLAALAFSIRLTR